MAYLKDPYSHPSQRISLRSYFKGESSIHSAITPFPFSHLDPLFAAHRLSTCNKQCQRETRLINRMSFLPHHSIFSPHTSPRPASTDMFLVGSERSTPMSTQWHIFPCLRAPEHYLSSPPPPHSLHQQHCSLSLLTTYKIF